ncbi:patatin-like phospholipase family protein [Thalassoglobus polymorphus]|uniref:NTE family protein RssA n=1 Tax=Thalassoglobus polymorphus TaxID=2527994 RepID=A0A517QU68_9PLAN|nr:patatin-like phospholipase family protein [Thalassoglobus polymorphus]QDT35176.1 NTE family protein RssA [Thalassoglobus polymorphus]
MKIGLALGGGGARGLAHLAILQVFDEFGIRPHRIAGTSIGAIVGAAYASGTTASELQDAAHQLILSEDIPVSSWFSHDGPARHWLQLLSPSWGLQGLMDAERFLAEYQHLYQIDTFDDLKIPMQIVAADYWTRQQIVIDSGDVMTAVRASMAVPGLFAPVQHENYLLVDGGAVNPVPFDLLFNDCDFTIAVDIMGHRDLDHSEPPNLIECILGTFQIMQKSILEQKLLARRPDVYLSPEIYAVRVMEFNKISQITEQTQAACEQLREVLRSHLET